MTIGLTGGIGSGKSTVAQLFELLDIPVYNSDLQAKLLMEQHEEIKKALSKQFGSEVYLPDSSLNRLYLAELIFKDEKILSWINSLIHPYVHRDLDTWKKDQKTKMVIIESAILIERMNLKTIDKIIIVIASKPIRLMRVKKRDRISESDILNRMDRQLEDEQRLSYADYVIYNEGHKSLIQQTLNIYRELNVLS